MRSRFCAAKGEGWFSRKAKTCRRHGSVTLAIALAIFGGSASPGFSESWWERMMGKGAPAGQPAPAAPVASPQTEGAGRGKNRAASCATGGSAGC